MDVRLECGKCGYCVKQIASNTKEDVQISIGVFDESCYNCGESEWLILKVSIHMEDPQFVES